MSYHDTRTVSGKVMTDIWALRATSPSLRRVKEREAKEETVGKWSQPWEADRADWDAAVPPPPPPPGNPNQHTSRLFFL